MIDSKTKLSAREVCKAYRASQTCKRDVADWSSRYGWDHFGLSSYQDWAIYVACVVLDAYSGVVISALPQEERNKLLVGLKKIWDGKKNQ